MKTTTTPPRLFDTSDLIVMRASGAAALVFAALMFFGWI